MKLSNNQRNAVYTNSKYCCVTAGAGSGKTRVLTERIRRLLAQYGEGEKMLAVTFSNKAADELRQRLLETYSEAELQKKVFVGTIHNFCMEMILQRGQAIGLSSDLHIFEDTKDRLEILVGVIEDNPRIKKECLSPNGSYDSKKLRNLLETISKFKRNLGLSEKYPSDSAFRILYQDYQDALLAQNAIDFDDILLYAYEILTSKPQIAKLYQRIYLAVCVDEAQDLNKAQYEVIKAFSGDAADIFMVGDPNQAIYGFNGSSSRYMTNAFISDYPDVEQIILSENYRSSKSVIDAAKVIEPDFSMEGVLPIQGDFEIHDLDDEHDEAEWICTKITSLLSHGHPDIDHKINLSDVAVLARNRYVFSPLEDALKDCNIAYQLKEASSSGIGSESSLFQAFDLGLRLIVNTSDMLHRRSLLKLLGAGNTQSLEEICRDKNTIERLGIKQTICLEEAWAELQTSSQFDFSKILELFNTLAEDENAFCEDDDRLLVVKDLQNWESHWKEYCRNTFVDKRSLSDLIRSIALGTTKVIQEIDSDSITLSTVHTSKGLEYDIVFIMGLNEGTFPDYRAINDRSQIIEEKHNMFVAITRSKRLCYLTFPQKKMMPWGEMKHQQASRFITALKESKAS